jgi:hypothetical protein
MLENPELPVQRTEVHRTKKDVLQFVQVDDILQTVFAENGERNCFVELVNDPSSSVDEASAPLSFASSPFVSGPFAAFSWIASSSAMSKRVQIGRDL